MNWTKFAVYEKATAVIRSCQTMDQLQVARKYANSAKRAIRRIIGPAVGIRQILNKKRDMRVYSDCLEWEIKKQAARIKKKGEAAGAETKVCPQGTVIR